MYAYIVYTITDDSYHIHMEVYIWAHCAYGQLLCPVSALLGGQDAAGVERRKEEEIYICSSRLGLIKMDHRHFGMVETVSNEPRNKRKTYLCGTFMSCMTARSGWCLLASARWIRTPVAVHNIAMSSCSEYKPSNICMLCVFRIPGFSTRKIAVQFDR